MLEKIIIISLLVFAIWYTMQPGEIFSFVNRWLHPLPDKLKQPIFECPVCMVPWHGSYLYWLIPWDGFGFWPSDRPVIDWLVTIIAAMGFNVVTVRFFRTDEEELTIEAEEQEIKIGEPPVSGGLRFCNECGLKTPHKLFTAECVALGYSSAHWQCMTCWEKQSKDAGTT